MVARKRDDVRLALIDLIVTGRIESGQKLNELKLSRELETSRTPLREALLHLEREGLVRSDQRRGFSVEPLSTREVRETYPLLCDLECFAVRTSFGQVGAALPALERINDAFARSATPKRALMLDARWHDTLMGASNNMRLKTMVARLRLAIARYEHVYMADRRLIETSVNQHRRIIAAIKRGDMDELQAAIEDNYRFGMNALLAKMGEV